MSTSNQEITNAIINDENLMSRLEKAESSQEVSELLAEKGISIDPETIDEFMNQSFDSGKLTENDLENVAGGGFKFRYLNPGYWIGRLLAAVLTKDAGC